MGSSMKKQGKTSQSSTTSSPDWALPGLKQGASDAQNMYNSGTGFNPYQGERVAPNPSDQFYNGVNTANAALQPLQYMQSQAESGKGAQNSINNLGSLATMNPMQGNPYFNQNLQNALSNASSQVSAQFGANGRLNSGAMGSALGNTLGQQATNAMSTQYNKDVMAKLAANKQMDDSWNAFNNSLAQNAATQANIGNLQSQQGQYIDKLRTLNDIANMNKWNEGQQAPWERLMSMINATQAAAQGNGTVNSSGTTWGRAASPWAGIAGGIAGLL